MKGIRGTIRFKELILPGYVKWVSLLFLITTFLFPRFVAAQDAPHGAEEITVLLSVQGLEGYEINALFSDDKIYVSIEELFRFLKISYKTSADFDSVSGFFLNEKNTYLIDALNKTARIGEKAFTFNNKEIFSDYNGLYLLTDVYGKIFNLNIRFNFRSLVLELTTKHELPVLRELRLEQMRKNINRISGNVVADTTLRRKYHLLRGTMVDWSLISTQSPGTITDTRASLGLGTEFLGGETNVLLNYSNKQGFDPKQQQYRWRWANNENKFVRQISAGKIPSRAISSIYAPLVGATVSNTPTTYRKTFGSYTLSDFTEPGWTVELYINNVIVDYTTADASGFFSFNVPLVYGSSSVTLRFYGPWGEERVKEQTITIPYNFLPAGQTEYTVTGGIIGDSLNSTYMKGETYYGIHRNVTIGGGIEYLSSVTTGTTMPFLTASARFLRYFLLNTEYTNGVRSKTLLSYRLPSNLTFELDYTRYVKGQKAISFNYLEERKASLSIPFHIKAVRLFSKISFKQNVLTEFNYSSGELLLSTYYRGLSANFSGYANWLASGTPYIYSNLSLGLNIGRGATFRPQIQYDFSHQQVISYKAELEKNFLKRAFLSVGYEENIRSDFRSFELTFRYDLPFAQTSSSARMINKDFVATESARGSIAFGSGNKYIHTDNRSVTGRAGFTIMPYLDINHNSIRDSIEPLASGLNIQMNGGRLIAQDRDTLIRIIELEPFTNYYLEIDDNSFENISWQIESKVLNVYTDPNQFKLIQIPVKVMGEANGVVYLNTGKSQRGQGRMLINFYDTTGKIVSRTLSENDGYFNYLGFAPGKYIAKPDSTQMNRLAITVEPEFYEFEIKPMVLGDIVDDIIFTLNYKNPDQINDQLKKGETRKINYDAKPLIPEIKITRGLPEQLDSKGNPLSKTLRLPETPDKGNNETLPTEKRIFFVQVGAFQNLENASQLFDDLSPMVDAKCKVIYEENLFKVRFGYFKNEDDARQCATFLAAQGYSAFIVFIDQ